MKSALLLVQALNYTRKKPMENLMGGITSLPLHCTHPRMTITSFHRSSPPLNQEKRAKEKFRVLGVFCISPSLSYTILLPII